MRLFYFSRCNSASPLVSRWLVAGVVEAEDRDDAIARLDAALEKVEDTASDFNIIDLADTERSPTGIIAITMGDRE